MTNPNGLADVGLLTLDDVAEMVGIAASSVRAYHTAANRRRRKGEPIPTDMPAPDVIVVRTPTWRPATIEAWIAARELRRIEAAESGERWASTPKGKG